MNGFEVLLTYNNGNNEALHKTPKLEPHHQMQLSVILVTLFYLEEHRRKRLHKIYYRQAIQVINNSIHNPNSEWKQLVRIMYILYTKYNWKELDTQLKKGMTID